MGTSVFVLGKDLGSTGSVAATAEGNVSVYDLAKLPGAQFTGSTADMPKSESYVSTKLGAGLFNTATQYQATFPGSDKLQVNSANKNDG
jgi:hypothetical protein